MTFEASGWAGWLASYGNEAPADICPVLLDFYRGFQPYRPELMEPYAFRLLDTRGGPVAVEERSRMALDWFCRVFAPTWMALAGLQDHAEKMRVAQYGGSEWGAAYSAARSAAYSAAYSAARSAAYSAAVSAARSAAVSAARSAAYSAALDAAYSAAYSAARSAADGAALDAADGAAYSAALDAASAKLKPTSDALAASAVQLFEQMLTVQS